MSDPNTEVTPMSYGSEPPKSNSVAIAALVLGLVSLVLSCIWYIAFPCGVLAIIFGVMGRRRASEGAGGRGMATAGLVLGVIGVVLPWLILAGVFIGGSALQQAAEEGTFDDVLEGLKDAAETAANANGSG